MNAGKMKMSKIDEILKKVKTVAIAGHVKPDGDCAGSCLGLYNYIKDNFPNTEVDIYLEPLPYTFLFMRNSDKVRSEAELDIQYDLFIALDCGSIDRTGFASKYFETAKDTLCIDHHISNNGYANTNFIEAHISSTCELLFNLMDVDKISKEVAECLYTGIVHDTGIFQYNCTSSKTMNIAGVLMDKGIDFTKIVDDTFFKKTFTQNKMLGMAMDKAKLYLDGKCIISVLTLEDMAKYNAKPEDLEGTINALRVTKDVEAGVLIYEKEKNVYRLSMRSNGKVDFSKIAVEFNGGGHVMAAGGTVYGEILPGIDRLLNMISEQLEQ